MGSKYKNFHFFLGAQLLSNVVLVSALQESESAVYIDMMWYMYIQWNITQP